MRLPIKREVSSTEDGPVFTDFDAFGGAICLGEIFVKECKKGEVVKKEITIPFRRGVVNKKVVFYYLRRGEMPPTEAEMIPSIWERSA